MIRNKEGLRRTKIEWEILFVTLKISNKLRLRPHLWAASFSYNTFYLNIYLFLSPFCLFIYFQCKYFVSLTGYFYFCYWQHFFFFYKISCCIYFTINSERNQYVANSSRNSLVEILVKIITIKFFTAATRFSLILM